MNAVHGIFVAKLDGMSLWKPLIQVTKLVTGISTPITLLDKEVKSRTFKGSSVVPLVEL